MSRRSAITWVVATAKVRPADLHEKGPDERDRQGHGQGERRPRARDRFEPHRAVEGDDLALDHVEADPAAGHGGEGARRGEAGVEHEGQEVPILRRLGQSPRARFLAYPLPVDAAPIVRDGDLHLRALQGGGDRDAAGRRLARGRALRGRLDPVVDRVADEVHEGVLEPLGHRTVELHLVAHELEHDLLARLQGQVPHRPLQALSGLGERDHPQAAHAGVQVSRRPHQPAASGGGVGHGALEAVLQLVDAGSDLLDGGPRLGGRFGSDEGLHPAEVRGQPRARILEGRPFVAAPLRLSNRQQQLAAAGEHRVEFFRADPEGFPSPSRRSSDAEPGAVSGDVDAAGGGAPAADGDRRRGQHGTGSQRGQGRGGERLLLLEASARVLDRVRGCEEDLEGLRVEGPLAVPRPGQDVLQAVACALDDAHVHRARGSFEVVRGAEERLQQARRIALPALEREEIAS